MPGDTCATCRLDLEAEQDDGAHCVSCTAYGYRGYGRVHAPLYLGNWPGKEEEDSEEEEQGR